MLSFLEALDIDAPADVMWTTVADYARDPGWRSSVREMRPEPPGLATTGTVTHEVMRVGGRTYRNVGLVDRVVPGRRLEWHTTQGADASGSRTVEPLTTARCRVTLELHVTPHGIDRLVTPILRLVLARGLRRDLLALASLRRESVVDGETTHAP